MEKLFFILSASVGSIAAGYILHRVALRRYPRSREGLLHLSRQMKFAAFFFIQPVAIVSTFWTMAPAVELILYPVLGIVSALIGGAAALLLIRILHIPPRQAASVFVCGMFANVLTIAGLIGFVFFREAGYRLAQLFSMFVSASYYLIGYPVSNNISRGASRVLRLDIQMLRERPVILVPVVAMVTGVILNVAGLQRPAAIDPVLAVIVPAVSVLLGFSIGLSLRLATVSNYLKEIGVVVLIKFLIMPAILVPIGMLLGFHTLPDRTAFQMLVVLSVMPVAFNALVPPAVFGFDLDLANAAWLVTTAGLIIIVPLLWFFLL